MFELVSHLRLFLGYLFLPLLGEEFNRRITDDLKSLYFLPEVMVKSSKQEGLEMLCDDHHKVSLTL